MAVRIRFDNTHNVITPTFVLATRNGTKLGAIPATHIVVSDSFNSRFDLEFQVQKYDNGEKCALWDELVDFKLVWVREWDVWFEIYVEIRDEDDSVKNITGISVGEAELSQLDLHDIEINTEDDIARSDYVVTILYNPDNPEGSLLNRIMEKAPHYTIKHVDSHLANMQRTFTFDNTTLYDAFQTIAEELDCIFVIDSGTEDDGSIARGISVYDLEDYCPECGARGDFGGVCPECGSDNILAGYGEETTVFVSVENLADDITYQTDTDSVKNCFWLTAGDDLMTATVRNCSPTGSRYLWGPLDAWKDDMSDELRERVEEYDELYAHYQTEHEYELDSSVLEAYNELIEKYQAYDSKLEEITSPLVGYPALMQAYYDTIDFYLYLHDSLMPTVEISSTTAEEQAALLTVSNLSPVAVQNLSSCSESTASSAVLSIAKILVRSTYQVKVNESSYDSTNYVWTGNFKVTNYYDDDDTAISETISITITGDYETFVRQKLEKAMSSAEDETEVVDISSVFGLSLGGPFEDALKRYSLVGLESMYNICQTCIDILIEQGLADGETWGVHNPNLYEEIYLDYYYKLAAIADETKVREDEIAIIAGIYDADGDLETPGLQTLIDDERTATQAALDFEAFLGTDLLLEFSAYRRDGSYTNENYISDGLNNAQLFQNAEEFLEVAQNEAYKSATLQHSITATLQNLLVMREFEAILDMFSVGNWIRLKVDDKVYRLRLIYYQIDFDNLANLQIEFSDVKICATGVTDAASIIMQAASMATSYDTVSRQASQGESSHNVLDNWFANGLDVTNTKIVAGASNQTQQWDEHGILCRQYNDITDSYSDTQLKILNSSLVITDDNWLTVRTAVGQFYYQDPTSGELLEAYGINGEVLVGRLILGESLGIYTKNNSMTFDENGLIIDTASGMAFTILNNGDTVVTVDSDGNAMFSGTVYASDGSFTGTVYATDGSFTGTITSSSGTIGGWDISSTGIYSGTTSMTSDTVGTFIGPTGFRQYASDSAYVNIQDGVITACGANISGEITATTLTCSDGTIGGWKIGASALYDNTDSMTSTAVGTYIGIDGIRQYASSSAYVNIENGVVTAYGANVSGVITATTLTCSNGTIGGWSIGTSSLYNNTTSMSSTTTGTYIGMDGIRQYNASTGHYTNIQNGIVETNTLYVNGSGMYLYDGETRNGWINGLGDGITVYSNGSLWLASNNVDIGSTGGTISLQGATTCEYGNITVGASNSSSTYYLRVYNSYGQLRIGTNSSYNMGLYDNVNGVYLLRKLASTNNGYTNSNGVSGYYIYCGNGTDSLVLYGYNVLLNGLSTAVTSDRSLKDDIAPLSTKYDNLIELLTPRSYEVKNHSGEKHIGFVVDEVETAMREAGLSPDDYGITDHFYDDETGEILGTIRYEEIIPMLVHEIQSIKAELAELKA